MIAIYVLFNALAADGSGIWSHWPLTTDPWIVVSIYDLLYKASEEKKLTVRNSDIQAINRQAENWYWWKMFGWKLVLVENVWWKMFGRKLFLVEICWCKIFSTEQGNIVLVSLWILNAEFRNMYKPTENTIDNTQTNLSPEVWCTSPPRWAGYAVLLTPSFTTFLALNLCTFLTVKYDKDVFLLW